MRKWKQKHINSKRKAFCMWIFMELKNNCNAYMGFCGISELEVFNQTVMPSLEVAFMSKSIP